MFDFTSLYSSKCSVRLIERRDKRLLMGIVGDSLHEVGSSAIPCQQQILSPSGPLALAVLVVSWESLTRRG